VGDVSSERIKNEKKRFEFRPPGKLGAACCAPTGKSLLLGEKYGLECFSNCARLKEQAPNEKAA